jgi:hypothetical protein
MLKRMVFPTVFGAPRKPTPRPVFEQVPAASTTTTSTTDGGINQGDVISGWIQEYDVKIPTNRGYELPAFYITSHMQRGLYVT